MTTPHSSAQLSLNFISTKASAWPRVREDGCSISRHLDGAPQLFGAIGLLLLLTFSNTAPAQNLPVAHWINDAGDDAVTVLNAGGVFITSFKAHNDLKVTQLSGQVTSIYLDTFGGDTPGNNPAWLTQFVGADANGTGDEVLGDINDLEMSGDEAGSLQFDFLAPLYPTDRILLSDVDGPESYLIQAYQLTGPSTYTQVSLSQWIAQDFSGGTGMLPDSTWPVWNGAAGTLASGTSDNLGEEVFVLIPDRYIDRLVITKQAGSGWTTAIQFFSPPAIMTTSPLPSGKVGVFYSQALAASGGTAPYTWSVVSGALPSGLTLSSSGVISGQPTAATVASFTIELTDHNGVCSTGLFRLQITAPTTPAPNLPVAHWINNAGEDAVTVLNGGGAFTTSFKAQNDMKVTQLTAKVNSIHLDTFGGNTPDNNPSWLTQFVGADSNGTGDGISGDVKALAMSNDGTGSLQFDFLAPLYPRDRILFSGVDGPQSYLMQAYQLAGPSTYTQVSLSQWVAQDFSGGTGMLPDSTWPVWNGATGTLASGTPDNLGEDVFVLIPDRYIDRLVITKQAGAGWTTAIQFFSPPAIMTTSPLPSGKVGVFYSQALAAEGGTAPYTWSLASGALPSGLTPSSSGVISGTPTAATVASFTIKLTDHNGVSATGLFRLQVAPPGSAAQFVAQLEQGKMLLTLLGDSAQAYVVQCSPDLVNWTDLTTSQGMSQINQPATDQKMFYRVRTSP